MWYSEEVDPLRFMATDPHCFGASSREPATGCVPSALKFKEVMKKLSRGDKTQGFLHNKTSLFNPAFTLKVIPFQARTLIGQMFLNILSDIFN